MWLVPVYNIVLVDCVCNCDCGPGLCKFQRLCEASTGRQTEGDSTERKEITSGRLTWGRQEKPLRSTTPFWRTTHSSRDTNMFLDFALYDLSNSVETDPKYKLKESWICLVYVCIV